VSLLLALPLLPLVVALWLALTPRAGEVAAGWVVALVAAFPVAVAGLVPSYRFELPELLVQGTAALVLDQTSRAALLLFGGLWLAAGLLLARRQVPGRGGAALPLLIALAGAITLALAEGGPLVYAGLLATGYGLYAVMAEGAGEQARRSSRALIVLLVASDLLVFELLLSVTAKPGVEMSAGMLMLGLGAFILRGGMPPAHAWLPPALESAGAPAAVLLAGVPPAAALFGALKLLPEAVQSLGTICLALGVAGAGWAVLAGLAQAGARATLGYAVAATAALLLVAFPAGAASGAVIAWLGVALVASCAALPLLALHPAGWTRDVAAAAVLLAHGLAAGQAAWHAASALPGPARWLTLPVALCASLLLTVTARRTLAPQKGAPPIEPVRVAYTPLLLACVGLLMAWDLHPPKFASAWVAPVGISLGLTAFRFLTARATPPIPPGDLLVAVERLVAVTGRWLHRMCTGRLPVIRDRLGQRVLRLWDGAAWSRRLREVDLRLRAWPATSLMMLLFALGAAFLLAR
jgi:hypothetical protein